MPDPLTALDRSFRAALRLSRALLRREFRRQDPALADLMRYILRKQVASEYPFVFLNSFCRRPGDARRVRRLAAAVHLLQSSTFVTDDIFDHAPLRYGQPAVHVRYGVSQAVSAATLMQSVAFRVIFEELERGRFPNRLAVAREFNQIVLDLYRGQYLDLHYSGDLRMPRREYRRIIALGGGNHFAHLAKCGALLAGKSRKEVSRLERFGYHYGMALFLTDDITDAQPAGQTGKRPAADLKNRRVRLPVLLALQMAGPNDAAFLRRFYRRLNAPAPRERNDLRRAAGILRRSGALRSCRREAERHVSRALRALRGLRRGAPVARLQWLAETLIEAQNLEGD